MVAVGDDLYLSSPDRGLLHYDANGALVGTIADVGYSFDLAVAAGSVWVPDHDSGELIRIDPTTDQIVARVRIAGINAHSVVAADTAVFVTAYGAGTVSAVDPATNEVTAHASVPGGPMTVTIAGGAVWVAVQGRLDSFQPS